MIRKRGAPPAEQRQRAPGGGRRRGRKPRTPAQLAAELGPKKQTFLDLYRTGLLTIEQAARKATGGPGASTIYFWRKQDPVFDAQVQAVIQQLDELRVQLVEDSLFQRLQDGKATGVELVFFLSNRAPARWKHAARIEHTGAGGGPIQHGWDLTKLNPTELEALEKLRVKAGLELVS